MNGVAPVRAKWIRWLALAIIAILSYYFVPGEDETGQSPRANPRIQVERSVPSAHSGTSTPSPIEEAYAKGQSGFMAEVTGVVERLLPDDDEGARHQRFILELPSGHTLLVAHNIDLASRVPAQVGDSIALYGQYEHNDRGGVLHWTHRSTRQNHESGWILHRGTRYD